MIDDNDPNQPIPPDASLPEPSPSEAVPPVPATPEVVPETTMPTGDIATTLPVTAIAKVAEEEIKPLQKRKTLSIIIHDAGVLRAAYMQFVKGGGLFIPTKKPFAMGEDTNLIIRLLDDDEPYRVSGKVVWITPTGAPGAKAGGIGVEFADDKNGERLRSRIEIILGPHLKSTESTHTM